MAGEFEGGVCGGNWWNLSKNIFSSSPCSLPMINDIGSFGGWPSHDPLSSSTTRSSDDSTGSASDHESVMLQEFVHQPHQPKINDNMIISMDSSFLPDTNPQPQWNHDFLLGCGKSDQDYSHYLLQEVTTTLNSSMDYRQHTRSNNLCEDSSFCNQTDKSLYNNSVISLLQNLFDDDDFESKPKEHFLPMIINPNQLLHSLLKPTTSSPMMRPTQQNHLQVTNNSAVWDAKLAMDDTHTSLQPSSARPSSKNKAKKANDGPPLKRPRIETPSSLPTFKIRKEKLGDRVTALQQLVSPFGKNDTASVLYEAIEYIKFLHDQVNALSTRYMKSGSPPMQGQQPTERFRNQGELKQDLKNRGLCLVPLSSTFSIGSETTADFWTPNFGGSFR